MKTILLMTALLIASTNVFAQGKKKKTRDVQEVNFSEMSLKGTIRNPDGAYLVQKRGIKFAPLHEVQQDVDRKIRETAAFID